MTKRDLGASVRERLAEPGPLADTAISGIAPVLRDGAFLARARISIEIDIGFGDVVTPSVVAIEYPTLLEFPAPVLRAYPKETVVAGKIWKR